MYIYVDSVAQLVTEVLPLIREYLKQKGVRLALDIETYNAPGYEGVPLAIRRPDGTFRGYIRTIQIGLDCWNPNVVIRDIQFVIDARKIGYAALSEHLKDILENATIIGQNLKYEYQFLFAQLGIKLRRMYDLMLVSQILYAGDKVNHGLGDLYRRFLDDLWFYNQTKMTFDEYQQFKKDHQQEDWSIEELTPTMLQYAADDVRLVFPLFEKICEKLDEWHRTYEYDMLPGMGIFHVIVLECRLIPVFALMELRGIRLNRDYWKDYVVPELERRRDEAERKVAFTRIVEVKRSNGKKGPRRIQWFEYEEHPMNLRSTDQLKERINELLLEYLPDSGLQIEGTGEDVLKDLLNKYSDEDNEYGIVLPDVLKEKLRWILHFKKASSLLSKYGQKLYDLAGEDGKLYPSWYQIGTDDLAVDSGRSSCRHPNMMNIPSRGTILTTIFDEDGKPINGIEVMTFFRQGFIPDADCEFLDADYSQEEPRIAAEYCNEVSLIEAFQKGGKKTDIHAITAKALMNLDELPTKDHPDETMRYYRDYIGKTAGLSLLYGIYWKSLREFMYIKTDGRVVWNDEEAKEKYENYFKGFPAFRRKMKETERKMRAKADQEGSLAPFRKNRRPFAVSFTLFGRARRFCLKPEQARKRDEELRKDYLAPILHPKTKEPVVDPETGKVKTTRFNVFAERLSAAGREGFNHVIQGTAADILKFAILDIHNEFERAGFDWTEGIVAVIHDEILVQVRKEHIQIAKEIMARCMKEAGQKFLKQVPIEIDINAGPNWAYAKNPPKQKTEAIV